jgi:hypothetical protein
MIPAFFQLLLSELWLPSILTSLKFVKMKWGQPFALDKKDGARCGDFGCRLSA